MFWYMMDIQPYFYIYTWSAHFPQLTLCCCADLIYKYTLSNIFLNTPLWFLHSNHSSIFLLITHHVFVCRSLGTNGRWLKAKSVFSTWSWKITTKAIKCSLPFHRFKPFAVIFIFRSNSFGDNLEIPKKCKYPLRVKQKHIHSPALFGLGMFTNT